MAPGGLLSPAAVNNHHHPNPSLQTATNPSVSSICSFFSSSFSTNRIISSHRQSQLPSRNFKSWRGRCGVASPRPPSPPESKPPPDDDQSSNSGIKILAILLRVIIYKVQLRNLCTYVLRGWLHPCLDFKKVSRFFVLFFSGCLSSFGHLYGMEEIMADLIRDLNFGNESFLVQVDFILITNLFFLFRNESGKEGPGLYKSRYKTEGSKEDENSEKQRNDEDGSGQQVLGW
ncbi:hypothetical protein E3N88_39540 [Mikania micrantha]|uniref:Uncharacterized protein n=1 Tax=Mikania micrantha TaxID=192012 RepID=A0A5N6LX28_9ASTR|nr:hypothetical protein E3N88_39540 [Mikania micrantha]